MKINSREAVIDWRVYRNPFSEEALVEVAGAHCEAGVTNLYGRINDFVPRRNERIDPNREHGEAELLAHKNSFELMDAGYNLVVWISPPGGSYFEGRINFMVNKNGVFEGWGIPAMRSGDELVELAKKLEEIGGVTMDGFETVEELRRQPIGLEKLDEKMKKNIEDIFDLPGMWKYIENEQKAKKAKIIVAVKESLIISKGDNQVYYREMERRGYKLMALSDHGSGGVVSNEYGVSKFQMERDGNVILEKTNGKYVCPCGEVVNEGQSKCPKCGLRITLQ